MTESTKEREQKSTMATAWALNSSILEQFPASAALMQLSAFFGAAPIPFELLHAADASLPEPLSEKLRQVDENSQVLDELLGPLQRLSLARRSDETRSYSIHPLMQEAVREGLTDQRSWAERAVRVIGSNFPDVTKFENWPALDRLLPHALNCAAFIESLKIELPEAALLLNETACYLDDRAEYSRAEPLHRQALAIRERVLGPVHPATATSLNNLALLYQRQARYGEAEPLYQRALAIREKVLGPEDPDTAQVLNNLALLLKIQGRIQEAEPVYQRALAIFERARGPEHPDVAISLNNLAQLLKIQGRKEEADPLYRRALVIDEKVLGPDHPDTAIDLNNLAGILTPAEAEPLYRRALAIFEKALGPEHPNTVTIRNNLIIFYREQGKNAGADALENAAKEKAQ